MLMSLCLTTGQKMLARQIYNCLIFLERLGLILLHMGKLKQLKIDIFYRKPFLNDTWKAVTSTGLTTMEYMDINPNSGMKAGYRTLDRVLMSQVRHDGR